MTRQYMINPVTGARVVAEKAEQVAHEVRRTVAAVEGIVDGVKVVYKAVVFPLVEWLKVERLVSHLLSFMFAYLGPSPSSTGH